MKKMMLFTGAAALAAVISGCADISVAGVSQSDEEKNWERALRESYPGYRAPKAAAQASFDNTESRTSAVIPPKDAGKSAADVAAAESDTVVTAEPALDAVPADAASSEAAPSETSPAEAPKADVSAPAEAPKAAPAPVADGKNPPDPTMASKMYEVKSGDTLGKIAKQFYGKASLQDMILRANSDIIKDPNRLKPGMKLLIPDI